MVPIGSVVANVVAKGHFVSKVVATWSGRVIEACLNVCYHTRVAARTLGQLKLDGAGVDGDEGRDEGAHCLGVFDFSF